MPEDERKDEVAAPVPDQESVIGKYRLRRWTFWACLAAGAVGAGVVLFLLYKLFTGG